MWWLIAFVVSCQFMIISVVQASYRLSLWLLLMGYLCILKVICNICSCYLGFILKVASYRLSQNILCNCGLWVSRTVLIANYQLGFSL